MKASFSNAEDIERYFCSCPPKLEYHRIPFARMNADDNGGFPWMVGRRHGRRDEELFTGLLERCRDVPWILEAPCAERLADTRSAAISALDL